MDSAPPENQANTPASPCADPLREGSAEFNELVGDVTPAHVLEASPDAMIVVNGKGIIVYVNGETEKLFGYARREVIGQTIEALIPESYRHRHVAHRTSFANSPRARAMGEALNIVGKAKDGSEFPADVKLSPLRTREGLLVVAAIRDVTHRKRSEEQLRMYARYLEELKASVEQKNIELEARNRELEQFAYVSSHDLQEPLRKIIAFGDRLKTRNAGTLDERSLDYLARMQSASSRMQRLISDLLEFSRLTTRGKPFEPVNLSTIVSGVVSDLEVTIERSGGKVEVGDLATIDADAGQMRQLFQNLIGNALKFHREDVAPEVKVRGVASAPAKEGEPPKFYEIRVEDNGIGIESKYLDRIFTVFERLNSREQYEGTGIGLAICKKIAERHGGRIRVESEPGRGTTFVVSLPQRQLERGEP